PRYRQLSRGWLPRTWDGRQKKLEITRWNERIQLLDNIYFGDLWAIGYATRPDGSDELTRVPRQLFFVDHDDSGKALLPEINWGKGEIAKGDRSYFDIHVVHAPDNSTTPE